MRTAGQREARSVGSVKETNHVNQDNGEVGGVGADCGPRDALRPLAGIPSGILTGAVDGEGQSGGSEEEDSGEGGEGTHYWLEGGWQDEKWS